MQVRTRWRTQCGERVGTQHEVPYHGRHGYEQHFSIEDDCHHCGKHHYGHYSLTIR